MTFIPRGSFPEKGDIIENKRPIHSMAGEYPPGHQFVIRGYKDEWGNDFGFLNLESVERLDPIRNDKYGSISLPALLNITWEQFEDFKTVKKLNEEKS